MSEWPSWTVVCQSLLLLLLLPLPHLFVDPADEGQQLLPRKSLACRRTAHNDTSPSAGSQTHQPINSILQITAVCDTYLPLGPLPLHQL